MKGQPYKHLYHSHYVLIDTNDLENDNNVSEEIERATYIQLKYLQCQ